MSAIKLDPEWKAVWDVFSQMPKPVINDVFDLRKSSNAALAMTASSVQVPAGIEETKYTIPSVDGTHFDVHRFVPAAAAADPSPQRAIVYGFGGGMIAGNSTQTPHPFFFFPFLFQMS